MIRLVSVQFSGNAKEYKYTIAHLPQVDFQVGDRVVVPNKLKDDLSLGLTIATVTSVGADPSADHTLLPVVCIIPREALTYAKDRLIAIQKETQS